MAITGRLCPCGVEVGEIAAGRCSNLATLYPYIFPASFAADLTNLKVAVAQIAGHLLRPAETNGWMLSS
jgi:hypothetical protein